MAHSTVHRIIGLCKTNDILVPQQIMIAVTALVTLQWPEVGGSVARSRVYEGVQCLA